MAHKLLTAFSLGSSLAVAAAGVTARAADPVPAPANAPAAASGVGALGRIEPQSGLIALGAAPGQTLLSLTVKEGDTVKEGQALGTFSGYPEQVAARDQAAAQLAEAQARLKAVTDLGQAQIDQAEGGSRSADKQKDAAVRTARANAEQARVAIPIDSLTKAVAMADARIKGATLIAPIAGTVLGISTHPGENVGNSSVLTIGDVSKMRVMAEVYETDIGRVHTGQTATIRSRALAQPLTGHVVEIGHMVFKNSVLSSDPASRIDARIVQVWIALDNSPDLAGLSNLTVDVSIAAPATAAGEGAPKAASR